jgi:hypothetical protein
VLADGHLVRAPPTESFGGGPQNCEYFAVFCGKFIEKCLQILLRISTIKIKDISDEISYYSV